jgi:MFS family permease
VLIYLLLAGAAARTVRATLLAFFALSYGLTLASHATTIGIAAPTWLAAGILIPFAFLGGLVGRPIGDRLGAQAFAMLAIALLAAAGAYTLGAAAVAFAAASDNRRGSPRARHPSWRGPVVFSTSRVFLGQNADHNRRRGGRDGVVPGVDPGSRQPAAHPGGQGSISRRISSAARRS